MSMNRSRISTPSPESKGLHSFRLIMHDLFDRVIGPGVDGSLFLTSEHPEGTVGQ